MKLILGVFSLIFKLYVMLLFVITAIILYPILALTTRIEALHQLAFKTFALWSIVFRCMVLWPFKKTGNVNAPKGSYIIIANHASYADIFLLPSLLRRFPHVFLGKSEILGYPLIKTFFKTYNIPVYRGDKVKAAKSLVIAKQKLEKNWSIVIFPEGGIADVKQPHLVPFKFGAFKLAKEMNVPILPITLKNNFEIFSDPMDFLGSAHPGFSKVHFHPIITVEEIKSKSVEELRDYAYKIINDELHKK